ncbi:MAG: hypothetical protein ACO280_11560 [Pseudohongiellaceae bacterium]
MSAPSPAEYRQSTSNRLEEVERVTQEQQVLLAIGEQRMDALEAAVEANTVLTRRVHTDTAEMVAWIQAIKGATRVLEAIGKLAKPLAYLLAMIAVVAGWWASAKGFFHIGGKP